MLKIRNYLSHCSITLPCLRSFPTSGDEDLETVEFAICNRLVQACDLLAPRNNYSHPVWEDIRSTVRICRELNRGHLERQTLAEQFAGLVPGCPLILYVVKQNAGLIIYRTTRYIHSL